MVTFLVQISRVGAALGLSLAATNGTAFAEEKSKAKQIKLTPEFVAVATLKSSDSAQLLKNEAVALNSNVMRYAGKYGATADFKGSFTDDRNEPAQSVTPQRSRVRQFNMGVSKQFSSATQLRVELQNQYRSMDGVSELFSSNGYENNFAVSIKQQLFRNAFGRSDDFGQQSVIGYRDSLKANIDDRLQKVALDAVAIFYQARLSQWQAKAALSRLKRQKRLFKIIQINEKRGTAERADLLQVAAAVTMSKENYREAKNATLDIWQQLVIALKLPTKYRDIDPMTIILELGPVLNNVGDDCNKEFPVQSARVIAVQKSIEGARNSLKVSEDALRADIYMEARMSANAVDKDPAEIWGDAFGARNPQNSIVFGINMPLSLEKQKGDALEKFKQKLNYELQLEQTKSEFHINRDQYCRKIDLLNSKLASLANVLKQQTNRENDEQARFKIGKIDAFSVLQAGNDVTDAQLAIHASESQLYVTAWKLKYENGELSSYLKSSLEIGDLP
jgi:outer membrane protein TolC